MERFNTGRYNGENDLQRGRRIKYTPTFKHLALTTGVSLSLCLACFCGTQITKPTAVDGYLFSGDGLEEVIIEDDYYKLRISTDYVNATYTLTKEELKAMQLTPNTLNAYSLDEQTNISITPIIKKKISLPALLELGTIVSGSVGVASLAGAIYVRDLEKQNNNLSKSSYQKTLKYNRKQRN